MIPLTQGNTCIPTHRKTGSPQRPKCDRLLNRSPQRLSLTPDSEVSIDCEPSPPPHVSIDLQTETINSPPNDGNRIDSRPTNNSSETHHSESTPPNEDQHTSPPITSRNNTSRYGLRPNPTPKTYPDFLIHEITNARKLLFKTYTTLQLN